MTSTRISSVRLLVGGTYLGAGAYGFFLLLTNGIPPGVIIFIGEMMVLLGTLILLFVGGTLLGSGIEAVRNRSEEAP